MKRLLKFATRTFLLVTFLMPLLECFDTWDRPGLTSDTELPIFFFVLLITLVLLVATILSRHAISLQNARTGTPIFYELERFDLRFWQDVTVPPVLCPPLRI